MSLVYEALQKAEREKQRKSGIIPEPPPPPKPVAMPRPPEAPAPVLKPVRPGTPLLTALIACVGIVGLVAIVYLVVDATTKSTNSGGTVAATPPAEKPTPASAATTTPAAEPPAAGLPSPNPIDARYRITGIMKDPTGKFCAVINGKIVYPDYYVDGATVKQIVQDRVTLDIGGREAVVRMY